MIKISQLFVFIIFLAFGISSYAMVTSITHQPVAQQAYQSASSNEVSKVNAIVAKAQQQARLGKSESSPNSMILIEKNGEKAPQRNNHLHPNLSTIKQLESQLHQLNQAYSEYQQHLHQQLYMLQQQNQSTQSQIQRLTQAMQLMNQQLLQLPTTQDSRSYLVKPPLILFYCAFALTILLTIIMGFLTLRQQTSS